MNLYNDELVHYGTKGMKWGRRTSDDSGGSGGSRGGIRKKIDARDAEIKKQRASSDEKDRKVYADLDAKNITRRQAAKKFSEIAKENPKAAEFTSKEILAQVGVSTAIMSTTLAALFVKDARTPLRYPNSGTIGAMKTPKANRKGVYNITDAAKPRRK